MRMALVAVVSIVIIIAGCIAFGGEAVAAGAAGVSTWEGALTIYGPMGIMLLWFMYRERKRDEKEASRDKQLIELVEKCTEVMTKVEYALVRTSAENEKHRAATYRLIEEVKEVGMFLGGTKGNTRVHSQGQ